MVLKIRSQYRKISKSLKNEQFIVKSRIIQSEVQLECVQRGHLYTIFSKVCEVKKRCRLIYDL
jgi:hypothetical protein